MIISSLLTALLLAMLLYGRLATPVLFAICLCVPLLVLWVKRNRGHKHGLLHIDMLALRSRLAGWNTGLKVCTCVALLVLCIAANSFVVAAVVFVCFTAVNLMASRIGVLGYISLLTVPVTFVVLSGLVLLVDISPEPLGYLDVPIFNVYLCVTPGTQLAAGLVLARALGALCCLYALSLSTPLYEITAFLRRVHVPAIVVELMVLIYRYIFVLMACLNSMTTAAHARLGYRTYRAAWRSFGGIAANLLARSFAKASRSFDAMEARCYDGEIRFLERAKPLRAAQLALALGLAALPAAALLLERVIL